ncbi:alpha/beta fold hydrolase [Martelella alba]|uniref:Alpha/beta fold hydrolase n=1 Tax=Martelella alba TaxID=2590451 RepID=A0ABY2SK43_9HYPH|nr:alpha/beta fold hydrolase [Martelella alba]TKI05315.1 alpha/beta fold hydrolase [Martelella alba]
MVDYQHYPLGDFPLQSGEVLREGFLAYETHGRLNARRDNAVLLPSWYTGTHRSWRAMIGSGRALDPARYFIIAVNMFGNGLSSSPSNSRRQGGAGFPFVAIGDNVRAQHRLVIEHLGVAVLALIAGWSMGAMQGWHWAALYPQRVAAFLPICGTARCWPLNSVFLEGIKAALMADATFDKGHYARPPEAGLAAFGRCYAGWAYSAAFFRDRLYTRLNFATLEDLLRAWERDHCQWDANDLLCMLHTWQQGDIGREPAFGGETQAGLRAIRARTIVMPCHTDQYFTEEEARQEYLTLSNARWRPLLSPYGHCAGAPGRFAAETAVIEHAMAELLAGA